MAILGAVVLGEHGIVQEFSTAGQPKSDGLIQRFHQTLIPLLRAVLRDARLSANLWPLFCVRCLLLDQPFPA
jgi:transposase InsO family protein